MGQQDFTDDELGMLSEEERKAVLDDEDTAQQELQGSEGSESPEPSGTPSESEAESAAEVAAESSDELPSGDEEKTDQPQEDGGKSVEENAQRPFVPVYQAESIEGIDEQLKELSKQLNEGDIDLEEFISQRDALRQKQIEANLTQKFNQQSAEQLWN
jgi:hypothetical protein